MKESNIVELKTWRYSLDWAEEEKVQVNLNEYAFFECDYRLGSWHLRGYKCDRKTYKWTSEEVSLHWVQPLDLAEFIYKANKYATENTGWRQACKVSRFNNLHYSPLFYEAMENLFKLVKEFEEEERED